MLFDGSRSHVLCTLQSHHVKSTLVISKLEKASVNKWHNGDEMFIVAWNYLKHKKKVM